MPDRSNAVVTSTARASSASPTPAAISSGARSLSRRLRPPTDSSVRPRPKPSQARMIRITAIPSSPDCDPDDRWVGPEASTGGNVAPDGTHCDSRILRVVCNSDVLDRRQRNTRHYHDGQERYESASSSACPLRDEGRDRSAGQNRESREEEDRVLVVVDARAQQHHDHQRNLDAPVASRRSTAKRLPQGDADDGHEDSDRDCRRCREVAELAPLEHVAHTVRDSD